jgi:hypothetical protein
MNTSINIRPYQAGDEDAIVELLESAFGKWPNFDLDCSSFEHWNWKHKDNPLKKIHVLAESEDRIVGCQHTYLPMIMIGNNFVSCFRGTDLAVHSEFRKKGIRGLLRDTRNRMAKDSGVKLQFSILLNPIVIKSHQKRQHLNIPYLISLFVRILDINQVIESIQPENRLLKKYGFHLLKLRNRFQKTIYRQDMEIQESSGFKVIKIEEFDERINQFWSEIKNYYSLIIERSKDFLNWRYCDSRGGKYSVRIAEGNGEILGYIVLRIKKNQASDPDDSVGYIVDLLTLPNRLDVANKLLIDGIRYFDNNHVNLIQSFMTKNHSYEGLFRNQGFLDSRIRISVTYNWLNGESKVKGLDSPNRMHIQYGDTDWI